MLRRNGGRLRNGGPAILVHGPHVESVLLPNKTEATSSSPECQMLPHKNSGNRRPPREKAATLAERSPGAAERQPQRAEADSSRPRTNVSEVANRLGEDIYDHLLREAGDLTNPSEWYEIAVAAADHLKELILQSQDRNMPRFRSP
jgi:hypothetical protein